MPTKVVAVIEIDAPISAGDRVVSTQAFDRGQKHIGVVRRIEGNQVVVRHVRSCCESGRESESDVRLWTLFRLRPTAWEKILNAKDED
jgi:hypothetical protein